MHTFATRRKHSAGKFYPVRLTHQTWLLPIITCLHQWVHALAEQRFGSYEDVKKWLDEWMIRSKSGKFSLVGYSQIARKMGEMCNKRSEQNAFVNSSEFNVLLRKKNPYFILVNEMKLILACDLENLHGEILHVLVGYLFETQKNDFSTVELFRGRRARRLTCAGMLPGGRRRLGLPRHQRSLRHCAG